MAFVVERLPAPMPIEPDLNAMVCRTLPGNRPEAAQRYLNALSFEVGCDGASRQFWTIRDQNGDLRGWAHTTFIFSAVHEPDPFVLLNVEFDYIWLDESVRGHGAGLDAGRQIGQLLAEHLPLQEQADAFSYSEVGLPLALEAEAFCVNPAGRAVVDGFFDLLTHHLVLRTETGLLVYQEMHDLIINDFLVFDKCV